MESITAEKDNIGRVRVCKFMHSQMWRRDMIGMNNQPASQRQTPFLINHCTWRRSWGPRQCWWSHLLPLLAKPMHPRHTASSPQLHVGGITRATRDVLLACSQARGQRPQTRCAGLIIRPIQCEQWTVFFYYIATYACYPGKNNKS